jgi:nitroreductase
MIQKKASTEYTISELLAERWSPYGFRDRSVAPADLRSLFEAARWAASSYNEQPWNYLVATKEDPEEFERILSCLVEANQAWAKAAPVLALGVVNLTFARNNKANRAAVHDLGLASANIVLV